MREVNFGAKLLQTVIEARKCSSVRPNAQIKAVFNDKLDNY